MDQPQVNDDVVDASLRLQLGPRAALVAPTLCLAIGISQVVLSSTATLTRWKGGGFGMFATLDRPDSRFLVASATTEASESFRIGQVASRRPADNTRPSEVLRATAFPTAARTQGLAEAVMAGTWVEAADTQAVPLVLQHSPYGALTAPVSRQRLLERAPLRLGLSTPALLRDVKITVVRLRYHASAGIVRFEQIGPTGVAWRGPFQRR